MSEAAGALLVGVGNRWRRDDGVGPWLAGALAARGCDARVHAGDGAGLIELFAADRPVVAIDATRSGRAPGALSRFDAVAGPVPARLFNASTHEFGLAEAVETARALGLLPPRLVLWGIEGAEFGPGEGLSPAVAAAARSLLDRLAPAGPGAGQAPAAP